MSAITDFIDPLHKAPDESGQFYRNLKFNTAMSDSQLLADQILDPRMGTQRDWKWRGWSIRYTFHAPPQPTLAAESLLLIHGFGSSLAQWYQNIEALGQHRVVYAIDLLGFGASEKGAIAYNSELWVAQIYEFWRQFIGEPIVLIGHSLGALMSAAAAVEHPDMVQRLILMTVPNTRQDMVHARWMQSMVSSLERIFASPLLVRLIFHVARQPKFIRKALMSIYIQRDRVTQEVVSHFVNPTLDRGAAQTLCRLTQSATQSDYSPSRETLLERLKQPTLVLWGQKDNVVPLNSCESTIAANPNLKLVTIPDGGHCMYDECALDINKAILNWLQEDSISKS